MCGQYVLTIDEKFGSRFGVNDIPDTLMHSFKAYPGAHMPLVVAGNNTPDLEMMKWGIGAYKSFNARAETILDKPTFAESFKNRRCLVPVNGFFENKKFFSLRDHEWFSLAGIYNNGEYTVITTEPNNLVQKYHHRMALVLPPDKESVWLTGGTDSALKLLKPYPSDLMEVK